MCYIFPGSVNENQSKTRGHAIQNGEVGKWSSVCGQLYLLRGIKLNSSL